MIPGDLIGRVMGIFRAALGAGGVIGALGSGVLADATSGQVAGSLGSDLTTAWGAAAHPSAIVYIVPSLAGGLVRVDVQE